MFILLALSQSVPPPMTAFSVNEFYQRNRRVVIWAILFGLLWLLRDFFGLVFLSFVLAIIAMPLADFGERRLRLPHWLALALVYLLFLVVLASFVRFVVPSVASEANRMIGNLPATELRLIEVKNRLVDQYPTLRQPLVGFLASALEDDLAAEVERRLTAERARLSLGEAEIAAATESGTAPSGPLAEYFSRRDQLYLNALVTEQFQKVRDSAPNVINMLYRGTATTLLALLFSFLILTDIKRIKRGIGELRNSRIGDFYEEAAQPVV